MIPPAARHLAGTLYPQDGVPPQVSFDVGGLAGGLPGIDSWGVVDLTVPTPRVLIAHGWLGHSIQFRRLARRVSEAGFAPVVLSYPTLFAPFELAVDRARRAALATAGVQLHLVGFSMGGLVMRALAAENPAGLASLLLIGTPNAGSPIADIASRFAPTPALRRLMTTAPPLPEAAGVPVGCIAGSRRSPLGFLFREANDGRVSVSSALSVAHHDARVVPVSHSALPYARQTADLTVRFLRDGHF
jgi:pimeloyl-ACP methyl ester carboxylesterase